MRIARLELSAFGPFTNARLEFEHKPRALQLIYGPNEAGKSSTLRAVIALLYGIPARTGDAHVHAMTKLRIGGVLLDEQGARHEVIRRKGLKHTLLSTRDKPLPEDALAPLLGGLDEALFRQMFGLDHERLRQGAEALLAGGGNLSEGLFDAGTGARAIRATLASLSEEADALFRPRGRTPRLNAAIEVLREHQRAQREAALSPQAFLEQQRGLSEARRAREERVEKRRALFEEKARLARAIALTPLLSRLSALSQDESARAEARDPLDAWDAEHKNLAARFQATRRIEADLPRERARAERLGREIAELRGRVLSAGELHAALDTPTRTRIRKCAEGHDALAREAELLARTRAEQKAALALLAEKESALPAASADEALAQLVERLEREALGPSALALEMELAQGEQTLRQRARALSVSPDLELLAGLKLPEDLALSRLEQRHAELEQRARSLRADAKSLLERSTALERARDLLLTEGAPASLEELAQARTTRDRLLEQLWQEGKVPKEPTFGALSASVRLADELADRLRKEARQVAEWARIQAEQRALEREQAALAREEAELTAARAALSEETRALAASLGLADAPLRALRPHVLKLGQLAESAAALAARKEALRVLSRRVEAAAALLTQALTGALSAEHTPPSTPAEGGAASPAGTLAALLSQAKAKLEREARDAQERERLRLRREEASLSLAATTTREAAVAAKLRAAREAFARELEALGMSAALSPDEALSSLDELSELERKTRELTELEARIRQATRDLSTLTEDVNTFAQRLALDLSGELEPEGECGILLERIEQTLRKWRDLRRDQEERARERSKLSEQIAHLGDGASLAELRAQVRDIAPDRARARLLEIEEELEQLDQEIAAYDQTIGSKEASLSLLEQPSNAVSLAEELQSDLSTVRGLIRRYLEVRLSQTLLKREVELYRAQHQGPVLSRANQLFPRLTLERYRGLDVEYDEHDEAVLCAVRSDGKTVRVAGLSDGTRDQLYLALRVASIERFLEQNAPLPLILDDAFVHFDDQRAQAALEVLGELAGRTQVLLFTHHHRMVELARSALGTSGMVLHELDPARGVINLRDDGPLFARL